MIHIVVPGTPPRKNRRHQIVARGKFPRLINTKEFKQFCAELSAATAVMVAPPGPLRVQVAAYWDRQRHLDDHHYAMGDIDAPLSAILDGLQEVGFLDDDVRFESLAVSKHYDKANPRTEIWIAGMDK